MIVRKLVEKVGKLLMPKPQSLAKMAASKVQELANGSDKFAAFAKYSRVSDEALDVCRFLRDIAEDGRIDDMERDRIAEKLTPLFERLTEMI
mgnify:CR=1 FL=1